MGLTRRQILAFGSMAAVVGGAGGLGALAARWWDRPAADGLTRLSVEEAAFVRAFAAAAYPATREIPVDGGQLDLDGFFDGNLGSLPGDQSRLVRAGLHALDLWPQAQHGASFADLPPDVAAQVIDAWRTHTRPELRQAMSSLLLVLGMGFCTHPRVSPFFEAWHRCGYGR